MCVYSFDGWATDCAAHVMGKARQDFYYYHLYVKWRGGTMHYHKLNVVNDNFILGMQVLCAEALWCCVRGLHGYVHAS